MRKFCYLFTDNPLALKEVVVNGFNEADCEKQISKLDKFNKLVISDKPITILRDYVTARGTCVNGGPKVNWWHNEDYDIYNEISKFDGNLDFYLNESADKIQGNWKEGDRIPMFLDIRTQCIIDIISNFNPECVIDAGEDTIFKSTGFFNIIQESKDKELKFDKELIYESKFHHIKSHTHVICDLWKCIITDKRFHCSDKEVLFLNQCHNANSDVILCHSVEQAKEIVDILVNEYGNYETDAYGNQVLVIKDFDDEGWDDER